MDAGIDSLKQQILRERFGFTGFRPGQEQIVDWLSRGKHVLAVLPTGAGKSLCFQVPALVRGGLCVVVSPLVALMKDQVEGLRLDGIAAASINSSQSREENVEIWKQVRNGEISFLYMAPERLMDVRMLAALGRLPVSLIAIDEAHCISQWGASFRPEYEALERLHKVFVHTPIGAFTATADEATRADIVKRLFGDHRSNIHVAGFDRPNIRLHVAPKQKGIDQLLEFLDYHQDESGIVYALSRKRTEELAAELTKAGHRAIAYHAGLSAEMREERQNLFMTEEGLIVCATVAFGMGIDKPDVRFVIHADLPANPEAYYQEIGRAGRDGEPSDALMLFSKSDIALRNRFINMEFKDEAKRRKEGYRLSRLVSYAESATCRRQLLLDYFGQPSEPCGNCDICLGLVTVAAPESKKQARAKREKVAIAGGVDEGLLKRLKALRFKLAQAKHVPAYVIFHDRVLIEMAQKKPLTDMDLGEISGVGPAKLEKFGKAFLREIGAHLEGEFG